MMKVISDDIFCFPYKHFLIIFFNSLFSTHFVHAKIASLPDDEEDENDDEQECVFD